MPKLKCFGIQNMSLFRGVMILSGAGVGGGSLVYGNTLYQPGDEFFRSPEWRDLADWRAELEPHYRTARRMLGVTTNPHLTFVDQLLKETAEEMGRGHTFRPTEIGVFFGKPGVTVPDPYFGGEGPPRSGCIACGGCFVGCRHNAKNSLTKNYLWFAEKRGAVIEAERDVVDIRPLSPDGSAGYEVVTRRSTAWLARQPKVLRAKQVILSGGVLGTMRLLLRCKHQTRSLPRLSDRLGYSVRTNSETLVGISEPGAPPDRDYSRGVAISSSFHPNDVTHIEPCRYPAGSDFMRLLGVPMTDSTSPMLRPLVLLWTIVRHPLVFLKLLLGRRWAQSTVILLVMQTLDNKMRFALGRNLLTAFTRGMGTRRDRDAVPIPVYFPEAQDVARRIARKVKGIPQNTVNEVLFNVPDHRAHPGRLPHRRFRGNGGHRQPPPGVRLQRAVRLRRFRHPGQPRGQPQPDHHRHDRAGDGVHSGQGYRQVLLNSGMTAVSIRPYRIEDTGDLYQAAVESTAEVFPWLPWCRPGYQMADASGWVPGQVQRWHSGEEHQFVIQSADGRFLGGCGINGINREHGFANLGYWVRTRRWARGWRPRPCASCATGYSPIPHRAAGDRGGCGEHPQRPGGGEGGGPVRGGAARSDTASRIHPRRPHVRADSTVAVIDFPGPGGHAWRTTVRLAVGSMTRSKRSTTFWIGRPRSADPTPAGSSGPSNPSVRWTTARWWCSPPPRAA